MKCPACGGAIERNGRGSRQCSRCLAQERRCRVCGKRYWGDSSREALWHTCRACLAAWLLAASEDEDGDAGPVDPSELEGLLCRACLERDECPEGYDCAAVQRLMANADVADDPLEFWGDMEACIEFYAARGIRVVDRCEALSVADLLAVAAGQEPAAGPGGPDPTDEDPSFPSCVEQGERR